MFDGAEPTDCAVPVEGIMGSIHVKLFYIWTSGSGADVVKDCLQRKL